MKRKKKIFDDYRADIERHGRRKRRVIIRLVDEMFNGAKQTDAMVHTVSWSSEFIYDDEKPFEEQILFFKTRLRDEMAEYSESFQHRIQGLFSSQKREEFKRHIGQATDRKINTLAFFEHLKNNGIKYFLIEDIERGILLRCEEL